jgi:SprT protein
VPGTATGQNVEPIGPGERERVIIATHACIDHLNATLGLRLARIPVLFDLSGTAAGMFRFDGEQACIRFNPWIFAKDFAVHLADTVPHEVAHYAVHASARGRGRTAPHGREWQAMMRRLGVTPRATFADDLEGVPVRRQRRHAYLCGCRDHALSTTRHRRVSSGRARYSCTQCGGELRYAGEGDRRDGA